MLHNPYGGAEDWKSRLTAHGREMTKIKVGDFNGIRIYINKNPSVLVKTEILSLGYVAIDALQAGEEGFARLCVHHSLIIQKWNNIGVDRMGSFIKKLMAQKEEAVKEFNDEFKEVFKGMKQKVETMRSANPMPHNAPIQAPPSIPLAQWPNQAAHQVPQPELRQQVDARGTATYVDKNRDMVRPGVNRRLSVRGTAEVPEANPRNTGLGGPPAAQIQQPTTQAPFRLNDRPQSGLATIRQGLPSKIVEAEGDEEKLDSRELSPSYLRERFDTAQVIANGWMLRSSLSVAE